MKKLGFGCMRLPMVDGKVDREHFSRMIRRFMEEGFTYFDTAHGYIDEESEVVLQECLTSKYPRESYILTDKLSDNYFMKEEDIVPFFEKQLKICGVDYFDYYLCHAQHKGNYKKYVDCNAYNILGELKAQGRIKHIGISFHDKAEFLDRILTEQPLIEVVQIQLNYVDYEDDGVEGRKCYEVCRKHGKPVIVMEPVKGGGLINLPDSAKALLDAQKSGSYASFAIRFAAGFEGIMMVLSGMSNIEQMEDNISFMKEFKPLSPEERNAVELAAAIFKGQDIIACTKCRYCTAGCPKKIAIPDLFACLNAVRQGLPADSRTEYGRYTAGQGRASDCIRCGKCENICPQHLDIREQLTKVAKEFE